MLESLTVDGRTHSIWRPPGFVDDVLFCFYGSGGVGPSSAREKWGQLEGTPGLMLVYLDGHAHSGRTGVAWHAPGAPGIDPMVDVDHVDDVHAALGRPDARLFAAGFSAGGNFVQWLGVASSMTWDGLAVFGFRAHEAIVELAAHDGDNINPACQQLLVHGRNDTASGWPTHPDHPDRVPGPETIEWMEGRALLEVVAWSGGHAVPARGVDYMAALWGL